MEEFWKKKRRDMRIEVVLKKRHRILMASFAASQRSEGANHDAGIC